MTQFVGKCQISQLQDRDGHFARISDGGNTYLSKYKMKLRSSEDIQLEQTLTFIMPWNEVIHLSFAT